MWYYLIALALAQLKIYQLKNFFCALPRRTKTLTKMFLPCKSFVEKGRKQKRILHRFIELHTAWGSYIFHLYRIKKTKRRNLRKFIGDICSKTAFIVCHVQITFYYTHSMEVEQLLRKFIDTFYSLDIKEMDSFVLLFFLLKDSALRSFYSASGVGCLAYSVAKNGLRL